MISSSSGYDALVGEVEHRADLVVEHGDLAHDQPAGDEEPGQAEADQDRLDHRPDVVARSRVDPAEVQGPDANAPTVQTTARPRVAG